MRLTLPKSAGSLVSIIMVLRLHTLRCLILPRLKDFNHTLGESLRAKNLALSQSKKLICQFSLDFNQILLSSPKEINFSKFSLQHNQILLHFDKKTILFLKSLSILSEKPPQIP